MLTKSGYQKLLKENELKTLDLLRRSKAGESVGAELVRLSTQRAVLKDCLIQFLETELKPLKKGESNDAA